MARTVTVYTDDHKVLTVKDEPGPLLSTALPPPGFVPPTNPFLSAQAHDPFQEHVLREILERSSGFDDFLHRLQDAGYRTVEGD
jgi:hypothetical protein